MVRLKQALTYFKDKKYDKAYHLFLELANEGMMEAYFYLGIFYRLGLFVKENQKEGFKWFLKAAENGHPRAQYVVASSYYHLNGSYDGLADEIIEHYEVKEKADSMYYQKLHFFDYNGVGVNYDIHQALYWAEKAKASGVIDAEELILFLSEFVAYEDDKIRVYNDTLSSRIEETHDLAHLDKKYKEAYERYLKLDEEIKVKYKTMNPLHIDLFKVLDNAGNDDAEIEALNGNLDAAIYLGVIYELGFEIKPNTTKAVKWYKKAVELGSDYAEKRLKKLMR
ncbi:SEL1-like repeat protein [Acholeplasma hippikon]|uniref:Sel1 repeat n=1 Tax=Acholeplasma hippikon TaxID=264636 RepID=A0A449BLF5_9MOLU|nr:tetratricopeptide repeat protein [Acholeplasma hippikon]VEU83263.1 Sel1 repeat [Acholeplasma hippikon]